MWASTRIGVRADGLRRRRGRLPAAPIGATLALGSSGLGTTASGARMHVAVNGVRLYVDVENAGLVPDGEGMREKPTLLLLHGGPGFDHSGFKPAFARLGAVAQVIYYDHRGNGRSDGRDPADWTLAQWGDDVKGLCDALGIVRPIVLGLSFGGYVAQAYATRHPDHPGKLILMSTAARVDFAAIVAAFARIAGPEVAAVARAYWTNPTAEGRAEYMRRCVPYYRQRRDRPSALGRARIATEVALHFNGPDNEQGRLDFRADLAKVRCPVLVIAGREDPIVPPEMAEALVRALPPDRVRFAHLEGCGHDVHGDDPDRVFALLTAFIEA